jgi:NADP-dependent 3-hydroxy acid dehydrogenase YdfG
LSVAHARSRAQVAGDWGRIGEAAQTQVSSIQALRPEDIADAVAYIVTRDRRVAVNELLVRASEQTW